MKSTRATPGVLVFVGTGLIVLLSTLPRSSKSQAQDSANGSPVVHEEVYQAIAADPDGWVYVLVVLVDPVGTRGLTLEEWTSLIRAQQQRILVRCWTTSLNSFIARTPWLP